MTTGLHVTHTFQSAKADGTDNTLVRPSNWNADHTIVMDSGTLLGRQTAGNGAAEQITCTAAAASLLSQASIAAILSYLGVSPPTTGDAKLTLKTAADATWVMMDDGTIGNLSSGASNRANADTSALFTLLYNLSDANAPLLTSAGGATTRGAQGSASTAFANNCRMTLPKQLGRAFLVAGAGAGLTSRTLGSSGGEETHALTAGELAKHQHNVFLKDPGHTHTTNALNQVFGVQQVGGAIGGNGTATINSNTTGITIGSVNGTANDNKTEDGTAAGLAGTGHNNMQPWAAWNVMVKL